MMKRNLAILFLSGLAAAVACAPDPGRLALSFTWAQPPEEATLWLWVRVVEAEETEGSEDDARGLVSGGPKHYEPGWSVRFELEGVPYGRRCRVLVEARAVQDPSTRVLYSGESEPFEISAGDDVVIPVPMLLRTPAVAAREPHVALEFEGETATAVVARDLGSATVHTRSTGARTVVLANDPSFSAHVEQLSLETGGPMACQRVPDEADPTVVWDDCLRTGWDLRAGLPPRGDGQYTVYARFVDANDRTTEVYTASVALDTSGPDVLAATLSDERIGWGDEAFLTLSFSESVGICDSGAHPADDYVQAVPASESGLQVVSLAASGAISFVWTLRGGAGDPGTRYTFRAKFQDELSNESVYPTLVADGGEPLSIWVDTVPPVLVEGSVTVAVAPATFDEAGEAALAVRDGSTLTVAAEVEEAGGSPEMELWLGETRLETDECLVPEGESRAACRFSLRFDEAVHAALEGPQPLRLVVRDRAGNTVATDWRGPGADVRVDFTPPAAECVLVPGSDRPAGVGEPLALLVSPLEALSAEAPVALQEEVVPALTEPYLALQEGTRFRYARIVADGDGERTVDLRVRLRDVAGNETPPGETACTQGVVSGAIDGRPLTVVAQSTSVTFTSPEGEALETTPHARTGSVIHTAVTFDAPPFGTPTLRMGDRAVAPTSADDATLHYRLALAADPEELAEGAAFLSLEAADAAGNRTRIELGSIQIDVTPPKLVGSPSFQRDDGRPTASLATNDVYARSGTHVRVSFSVDAPLREAPTVLVGDLPVPLEAWAPDATSLAVDVPDGGREEDALVEVLATDRAGNRSVLALGTIRYDYTPPPALDADRQDAVELFRAPTGAEETEGLARFELRGCPPPPGTEWPWCPARAPAFPPNAEVSVFEARLEEDGMACATGALAASGRADERGGLVLRLTGQPRAVCVAETDPAGNTGVPTLVEYTEWVAAPTTATTFTNPVACSGRPVFTPALEQPGEEQAGVDALERADGHVVDVSGAGHWLAPSFADVRALDAMGSAGVAWGARWGKALLLARTNPCLPEWDGYDWSSVADALCSTVDESAPFRLVADPRNARLLRVYDNGAVDAIADNGVYAGYVASAPAGGPTRDVVPAAGYDEREGVLVFHDPASGMTWELHGRRWVDVTPQPGRSDAPGALSSAAVVFDRARGQRLLVGAPEAGGSLGIWAWADGGWSRLEGAGEVPPARHDPLVVYDAARQRVVLAGGITLDAPGQRLRDTWEWTGSAWSLASSGTDRAAPRLPNPGLAFFDERRRTVVAVTQDDASHVVLVEWDGHGWNPVGLRDPGGDGEPPPRVNAAAALDPVRARVVLFGGQIFEGDDRIPLDDTWEWDGRAWTRIDVDARPEDRPAGRREAALGYEPVGRAMVLFGGSGGGSSCAFSEPWLFDGAHWHKGDRPRESLGGGLAGRQGHVLFHDPTLGALLLFGGTETRPRLHPAVESPTSLFAWDGMDWTPVPSSDDQPTPAPCGDAWGAVAYDEARGRAVVVLDEACSGSLGTWEWDSAGRRWTKHGSASPYSDLGGLAYDARRGEMLRLQATEEGAPVPVAYRDGQWKSVPVATPYGSGAPSSMGYHTLLPSPGEGRVLLFGGGVAVEGALTALGETWEWDGGADDRPAIVTRTKTAVEFPADERWRLASVSARWVAGGRGPGTGGTELRAWASGEWRLVATGEGTPEAPEELVWTTSDAELLAALPLGAERELAFAVVAPEENGPGRARVLADAFELRLRHRWTRVEEAVEICDDGLDNDQDGKVDCRDPLCEERNATCQADPYEPDDTSASARPLPLGELQRRSICPIEDRDYLRVELESPADLLVEVPSLSWPVGVTVWPEEREVLAGAERRGYRTFLRAGAFRVPGLRAGRYDVDVSVVSPLGGCDRLPVAEYGIRVTALAGTESCQWVGDEDEDGAADCDDSECRAADRCCRDDHEPDDSDCMNFWYHPRVEPGQSRVHALCSCDKDYVWLPADGTGQVEVEVVPTPSGAAYSLTLSRDASPTSLCTDLVPIAALAGAGAPVRLAADVADEEVVLLVACCGPTCAGTRYTLRRLAPEVCDDGQDNDEDGATDCDDAGCARRCCAPDAHEPDEGAEAAVEVIEGAPLGATLCPDGDTDQRWFALDERADVALTVRGGGATVVLTLRDGSGVARATFAPSAFGPPDATMRAEGLAPGAYAVEVTRAPDAASPSFAAYELRLDVDGWRESCDDGADDDANGLVDCADPDCAGTDACCVSDPFEPDGVPASPSPTALTRRTICPAADEDWVALVLPEPAAVTLETSGLGGDTVLELLDSPDPDCGNVLALDDDGGDGRFARLDIPALAAGSYWVRVSAYGALVPISAYELDITVAYFPEECGDGHDNDQNGATDCADDACAATQGCP